MNISSLLPSSISMLDSGARARASASPRTYTSPFQATGGNSNGGTTASISDAAKALWAAEVSEAAASTSSKTAATSSYFVTSHYWLSDYVHESESHAKNMCDLYTKQPDEILYDAYSVDHPPLRFAGSNEVATDEAISQFKSQAQTVLTEREQIISSGLEAGLSYADIFDQIINHYDATPMAYREKTCWGLFDVSP